MITEPVATSGMTEGEVQFYIKSINNVATQVSATSFHWATVTLLVIIARLLVRIAYDVGQRK